jgi:hypothetical protein
MCLILSTQARPSSFYRADEDLEDEDERARHQVEYLLRLIVKMRNGGDVSYMDILSHSQGRSSGMGGRGDRRGYIGGKGYRRAWTESRIIPTITAQGIGVDALSVDDGAANEFNPSRKREASSASRRDPGSTNPDDSSEDEKYATARARNAGAPDEERLVGRRGYDTVASTYDEMGMPLSSASTFDSRQNSMATTATITGALADATKDTTLRPR